MESLATTPFAIGDNLGYLDTDGTSTLIEDVVLQIGSWLPIGDLYSLKESDLRPWQFADAAIERRIFEQGNEC